MSDALQALYSGDAAAKDLLPPDDELSVFEAAAFGRIAPLRRILEEDPEQVAARIDGFTPLHLAVYGGRAEACRLLIEQGADLNAISEGEIAQVSPLGTAAFVDSIELARLLLDAGADVDAHGPDRFTALHTAAELDDVELSGLLVAYGADRTMENRRGQRPIDLAKSAEMRAVLG